MRVPKTIQIRDVPDELHRELRVRAAAAGQSLSAYLLDEISRIAKRPTNAEVFARAALRGPGFSREEILEAIDEGRRSRDETFKAIDDARRD
jgi:plasmid stability protein